MADIHQNADGSLGFMATQEGIEVGRVGGPSTGTASVPKFRNMIIAVFPLVAGVDTAGALGAWAPPSGYGRVLVKRVVLDVLTPATAVCTVSAGVAASATTLNAGMLSGVDVHTAAAVFASNSAQGQNSGQYVTFSTASGASAGLVANAYIEFAVA